MEKITKLAYSQITQYGMNSKIGYMAYPRPKDGEIVLDKPFSEVTAKLIDSEVRSLVMEAYHRTTKLIREKRDEVEKIAKVLLEKEVLKREDMVTLLGARPFEEQTTFDQLVQK